VRKKAPLVRGFLFYLPVLEGDEPVEFMPVPVPDVPPNALLPVPDAPFVVGLVFVAPMLSPVVPCPRALPVFAPAVPPVPLTEEPPLEAPALAPPVAPPLEPPEPPPLCANAKVEVRASTEAKANVESFMVIPLVVSFGIITRIVLCSSPSSAQ
jgi:hypothetical protein